MLALSIAADCLPDGVPDLCFEMGQRGVLADKKMCELLRCERRVIDVPAELLLVSLAL